MIGGPSGCIRNGGNGPSRVSDTPPRDEDPGAPAAASGVAGFKPVSRRIGVVAVDSHSPISRPISRGSGSLLKVPRALWYSISSLISSVLSHSQATAKALARIRAEIQVAQRDLASASAIEYRTESTASAAGT